MQNMRPSADQYSQRDLQTQEHDPQYTSAEVVVTAGDNIGGAGERGSNDTDFKEHNVLPAVRRAAGLYAGGRLGVE